MSRVDRNHKEYEKIDDDDLEDTELRRRYGNQEPKTPDTTVTVMETADIKRPHSPTFDDESNPPTPKVMTSAHARLFSPPAIPRPSAPYEFPTKTSPTRRRAYCERPDRLALLIHISCCALIYPFLFAITKLAQNKSLFAVRVYVGLGCAIVGIVVGIGLIGFAKKYTEAAIWATLIHQREVPADGRMSLRELNLVAEDTASVATALRLMYYRRRALGFGSASKRIIDHRIWTLYLFFFLLLVVIAGALSFIFGRIVNIVVQPSFDMNEYTEVPVFGDLTDADQQIYYEQAQNHRISSWNNLPVAWNNTLPTYVASPLPPNSGINSTLMQIIYFPEAYPEQLRTDGLGISAANTGMQEQANQMRSTGPGAQRNEMREYRGEEQGQGNLLQFPRWGVRSVCEELDNMNDTNVFEYNNPGNFALVHLSNAHVDRLFTNLGAPVPNDLSGKLKQNHLFSWVTDSVPDLVWPEEENSDEERFVTINSTFSGSLGSIINANWIIDDGNETFTGWLYLGVTVLRLRTQLTPRGSFPLNLNFNTSGLDNIGYDAAICLEIVEPWIVEVYNSTRGPTSTRVVGKGGSLEEVMQFGKARKGGALGGDEWDLGRSLNSSEKYYTFQRAYATANQGWITLSNTYNSVSNILVSWTDGTGPWGYTTLSAERLASFRSVTLSTLGLPLLSGSRQLVARSYPSVVLASAHIENVSMIGAILTLLILGCVAGLCVPALPSGMPRRGVDLMSWITVLEGDGLGVETSEGEEGRNASWELERGTLVEDVDTQYGDRKINYPAE